MDGSPGSLSSDRNTSTTAHLESRTRECLKGNPSYRSHELSSAPNNTRQEDKSDALLTSLKPTTKASLRGSSCFYSVSTSSPSTRLRHRCHTVLKDQGLLLPIPGTNIKRASSTLGLCSNMLLTKWNYTIFKTRLFISLKKQHPVKNFGRMNQLRE